MCAWAAATSAKMVMGNMTKKERNRYHLRIRESTGVAESKSQDKGPQFIDKEMY